MIAKLDPARTPKISSCTPKRRPALPILALALVAASLACTLTACHNHDFPDYPANYREFAYVTNSAGNTVSVFDVVHVRLDREVGVGINPTGVTANPKRNEVYIVNSGTPSGYGSLSVIDATKNAVVATIPLHKQPYFVDVDPSGDRAYVANSGSNSVSIVDLQLRREIVVVGTGEGPGLARISPDGNSLVVTNRIGNSVSILNPHPPSSSNPNGYQVRQVIEGCPGATDAVILADSRKAFVACSGGHQIMAIALAHSAEPNSPASPQAGLDARPEAHPETTDRLEALMDVGRSPIHLALKPDGGELFVSNFDSGSISEVVTSTDDVGGAYLMGSNPVRGLVNGDNSLLYESDFRSQEISVYSIDDGRRLGPSIHVGDGPDALALSDGGNLLFAVDARSGDVAVIRTSTRSLFTLLPTGRQPSGIAILAFRLK